MPSIWNDDICTALKAGVADGKSYAIIGAELSGKFGIKISRNAAIGKAKRLGLIQAEVKRPRIVKVKSEKNRSGEHHTVYKIRRMNGNTTQLRVIQTTEFSDLPLFRCVDVTPKNLTLAELDDNACRYIAGDDHLYCGHPQRAGSSYCPAHHDLVWERPRPRAVTYVPQNIARVSA